MTFFIHFYINQDHKKIKSFFLTFLEKIIKLKMTIKLKYSVSYYEQFVPTCYMEERDK